MKPNMKPHFLARATTGVAGFTLLELLVVIVIIAIISTFVSLSLQGSHTDILEQEAQRLHALLKLASSDSISTTTETGVYLGEDYYQFYRLNEGEWDLLTDDEFLTAHTLPDNLKLEVDVEGVTIPADSNATDFISENPQILFFTDGELTPFQCTLSIKNQPDKYYTLQGMLNGQLELKQGNSL